MSRSSRFSLRAPQNSLDSDVKISQKPLARRGKQTLIGLALLTFVAVLISLGVGPVAVSPVDTARILVESAAHGQSSIDNALVITELRLPRVLMALLAGSGLAMAGLAMQVYFRNPLADPGITGVASGSATGAVVVLVFGLNFLGSWTLPVAAFAGAMVILAIIQLVSVASRSRSTLTILMFGIALNAFFGALTGALVANASDPQTVRGAMFWLQGDLTSANWDALKMTAIPVVVAGLLMVFTSREMNALLLGDETASSIGVSVTGVRRLLQVLTSVIVGCVVAVTGVIGFIGLVAPHMMRFLVGTNHRLLIPGSALLGGLFLVCADTLARTAPGGMVWQTGVVTALLGSPIFLYLVLRVRKLGGGHS